VLRPRGSLLRPFCLISLSLFTRTQTALSTGNKLIWSAAQLIHYAGLCYQL
jgi:hypothetical protein